MADDPPGIHEAIDERIAWLEDLAAGGDPHCPAAAQHLEAFRAQMILHRADDLGWAMLAVIEPLIESLLDRKIS